MKKSFIFIFCTLFIILSVQVLFSEDSDDVVVPDVIVDEPAEKVQPVEIIPEVDEKENKKLEAEKNNQPVQIIQPKEQPKRQGNNPVPDRVVPKVDNKTEKVEKTDNLEKRVLLPIADSNFKYSRIPDIKIKDASSSKNIVELKVEPHVDETNLNINEDKLNTEVLDNGYVRKKKLINIDTDVLAKIALLLFVGGVIVIYKLKSSKGLRKRKIKF